MKSMPIVLGVSIAFLLIAGALIQRMDLRSESHQETTTSLWKIVDVTNNSVTYKSVQWLDQPSAPNGFEVIIGEDEASWNMDEFDDAVVKVLCYREGCADEMVDQYVTITFDEYVAAREVCLDDPISCPYYSVGSTDIFHVTHSSQEIVLLVEQYLP